jgi:4-amino-4-deoxy-L-arabinose transferase-like glycosyltransferase
VLVKGPVAIAIPGVALAAFLACLRGWRGLAWSRLAWCGAIALAPSAIWLAAAWQRAGSGYVEGIVLGHGVAHPLGLVDKQRPAWFYASAFPLAFMPWTLLLPAGIAAALRPDRQDDRRFGVLAVCWLAAPLLLLTLSPAKRTLYLVPVLPAAALLVARLAARPPIADRALARVPYAMLSVLLLAGGVCAGVLCAASPVVAGGTMALGLAFAGVVVIAAAGALAADDFRSRCRALGLAAVSGSVFFAAVALPMREPSQSARPFLEQVAHRVQTAPLAVYGTSDYAANWVLRRDVIPRLHSAAQTAAFLDEHGGHAFLLAERSQLDRRGLPAGAGIILASTSLDDELVLLGKPQ